ncbi:MAG: LTA synthase family protein [Atopobiaceae bacterium]|nr:LTA synthase family protein [Atopobiaceae bacterium]
MSIPFASIYFLVLAALVATSVFYARKRSEAGKSLTAFEWLWTVPFALALVFLGVWSARGLVDAQKSVAVVPLTALVIGICGAYALRRRDVWAWYETKGKRVRIVLRIILIALIPLFAALAIEVPFNELILAGGASHFWLEVLLVGLLLLGLFFLGQRHTALCVLGVALCLITGIGQYFIKSFKNAAILPADLLALGTAAAVSKEYVYSLNERALEGIALALVALCLLSLVRPPQPNGKGQGMARTVGLNVAASAGSFALLAALVAIPSYMGQLGVGMEYWYTMDYYQQQGFYPTFIAVLQDMSIHRPDGYTDEEAQRIEVQHAQNYRVAREANADSKATVSQFEQLKPSVIAIMNESFADLSILDGLHAGYEGPEFLNHGLNDALVRGRLNVSVHGGGTCNSEFEFLTGNSMQFIGAGKYPYSLYDFSHVDGLASQFKELGYHTCALHPNYATNWNRDEIYAHLGFDRFLSIDDFGGIPDCAIDKVTPNEPHCEVFHSGVSDKATYDYILRMLKEDETPQFFFDVTMANHGSYDQNNIAPEYQTNYMPDSCPEEQTPAQLNEYLSCIKRADADLKELVDNLRQLSRPVAIVFFGDHQPMLSSDFNDYWFKDEPENEHARRVFSTNYVIWANYDVAGQEQKGMLDETSIDMLAAQTLNLIGAPVSDFQAAQLDIRTSIPSLAVKDYQGQDRAWYAPGSTNQYSQSYYDLSLIEYLNCATKV